MITTKRMRGSFLSGLTDPIPDPSASVQSLRLSSKAKPDLRRISRQAPFCCMSMGSGMRKRGRPAEGLRRVPGGVTWRAAQAPHHRAHDPGRSQRALRARGRALQRRPLHLPQARPPEQGHPGNNVPWWLDRPHYRLSVRPERGRRRSCVLDLHRDRRPGGWTSITLPSAAAVRLHCGSLPLAVHGTAWADWLYELMLPWNGAYVQLDGWSADLEGCVMRGWMCADLAICRGARLH